VAPFGNPADVAAWDNLRRASGVPVVIDAANGFDSLAAGHVPTMVSLHATKAFGVGEGGFVTCTDRDLIRRVRGLSNHGFTAPGEAGLRGVNAKLSEYAAAVGLAAFDAWAGTRAAYASLKRAYVAALAEVPGLSPAPGDDADWVTSTFNVVLPGDASPVIAALNDRGIGARRWWDVPCHRQPAYVDCPRQELTVTEKLAGRVMGLPFFLGMEPADVTQVAEALADAVAGDR
jgi:dTDP-4-amino-4,6-dideoxygalactose transaminase